jgi:hypothetical protein
MIYFLSIIIPLALLIPNLLFLKFKPTEVSQKSATHMQHQKMLTVFERIGQMGIFMIPIFYRIDLRPTLNRISLFPMIFSLLVYYGCWIRYFLKERSFAHLFKPLWGIPIPMAVFPIIYMLFASKILGSILLLAATLLLSIGHIPISYNEYQNTLKENIS